MFLYNFFIGYFIFLAALIEYEQIANPSDKCQRWSAFRNRSWCLSWLLSPDEKEEFLNTMIQEFLSATYQDITEMTSQESGL